MPKGTRNDPYAGFNFRVEINGIVAAGFSECSGLTTDTDIIEYREGSDNPLTVRKIPGLTHYSSIVLKRGLTADTSLWQWRQNIIKGTIDRRNGAIVLLDGAANEVARWNFQNGWPAKWEGPHLRAKASDVAIETLEIVHEGFEWSGT